MLFNFPPPEEQKREVQPMAQSRELNVNVGGLIRYSTFLQ